MTEILGELDTPHVLASALLTAFDDMEAIVRSREDIFAVDEPLVPPELDQGGRDHAAEFQRVLDSMHAAWGEIRWTRDPLVGELLIPETAVRLQSVGLAGSQLRFKLGAWLDARDVFADVCWDDAPTVVSDPWATSPVDRARRVPLWTRVWSRRPTMKWALKKTSQTLFLLDTWLGSLAKVLPPAELFKEFKETVERLANDRSDSMP